MTTKKVTKESKHEPTKAFDWQLYAEELEKECERQKKEIAMLVDEIDGLEQKFYDKDKAIQHLIIAMHYSIKEGQE